MEAKSIVQKLKTTPYKFTEAGKVRDYLRGLDPEDREDLLNDLRVEKTKSENNIIDRVLHELLNEFR